MTKDALLEVGCEELPASFILLGIRQLKDIAEKSFQQHHLPFHAIRTYGTPRRLAVCIEQLAAHSEDEEQVLLGPPIGSARTASGEWTSAAVGFARKHGVEPEDLQIQNERLCLIQRIPGTATRALLAQLFPEWITSLQFPKTMVWEPSQFRFPRPIRWIAALYGSDLVSFQLAGIRSGRWTLGLALVASKKVLLTQASKYVTLLKNQCVLVDPQAREEAIQKLSEQAVRRTHGHAVMNRDLLNQVVNLVEHPVAILGNFDPAYLDLPVEVLVTCLEHHQKFFPVEQMKEGVRSLLSYFIGIRNGMSVHQELVREGYERVLAARLADARFFYNHDCQTPLSSKVTALGGVVFQEKLGTLWDKKERIKALLQRLAGDGPQPAAWLSSALRTAELCKADLVTHMVREFPELQGIMARLYAQADQEPKDIAQACEEHYWPITLTGFLPSSEMGAAVAMADKLDTLAGDFAVGLIPTGSADPYGLRRAAVGVLRILEHWKWPFSLEQLLELSLKQFPSEIRVARPNISQELAQFMKQRFAAILEERGFRFDEIEAVLASGIGVVCHSVVRLEALHAIRAKPEFNSLAAAFKRAGNIIRQAQQKGFLPIDGQVQDELLKEVPEKGLFQSFQNVQRDVSESMQNGSPHQALEAMVPLRDPLDKFFDGVMVMVDDESLRQNRLILLSRIVNLFLQVADFSKLQNA